MKKQHLMVIVSIFFSLGGSQLMAQEDVLSTGASVSGPEGSVSYSLGQVAFISVSDASGTVSQGVQQPIEVFALTSIAPAFAGLSLSVFPNPAVDQANLKLEGKLPQDLGYRLLDTQGKALRQGKVSQKLQAVSLLGLPTGAYVLQVISPNQIVQSFKIVKHN